MDSYTPFRFRNLAGKVLVTNEVGDFGVFENGAIERFFSNDLRPEEHRQFTDLSVLVEADADWRIASLMRRSRSEQTHTTNLNYLILIPTLRCDLSCTYCQVSRAPIEAEGFDWGEAELRDFARLIDGIKGDNIKIEFQGGEPTLRTDLLVKMSTAE